MLKFFFIKQEIYSAACTAVLNLPVCCVATSTGENTYNENSKQTGHLGSLGSDGSMILK